MLNENYKTIFNKFNISDKDKQLYNSIIHKASSFEDLEQIINHFMTNYVKGMNRYFNNLIQDTLTIAFSEEILKKIVYNRTSTVFIMSSSSYESILKSNYNIITNLIVDKSVDLLSGNKIIKEQLVNSLLDNFNSRINGAMANTRSDVLQYVRTLQKEMIIRNQQLYLMHKDGFIDSVIESEKIRFKDDMLKKYPRLKRMMNEGKVLKSRSWIDKEGVERFKSYTLDDYTEMSVSETLKNADRDAVELTTKYYNEPVVEFYLRDNRNVETPNSACQSIMSKTIYGKHLLATNNYVANLLNIWTIDKAKSENSLNIAFHCRHSIKRCDDNIINKINKIIAIAKTSDVE